MLVPIHEEMTRAALERRLSPRALEVVLAANREQDKLVNQFGHDELHFDNNALAAGWRYIEEQRALIPAALLAADAPGAWAAFGRLIHTAQDFYSHTNYVGLWLEKNPRLKPDGIDPLDPELLASPKLHSGRLYFPLDWLYFIPPLKRFVIPLLPADSHGKMNLDSPAQGEKFAYARAAAVKRAQHEFERIRALLTPALFSEFCDTV